jgi:hypothetical protein
MGFLARDHSGMFVISTPSSSDSLTSGPVWYLDNF